MILRTTSTTKNTVEHRVNNTTVRSLLFIVAIPSPVARITRRKAMYYALVYLLSLILCNLVAHPTRYYGEIERDSLHR